MTLTDKQPLIFQRIFRTAVGWGKNLSLASIAALALYVTIPVYLVAMLICPILESKGEWQRVQAVWYDWQSLNVGVLALISSAIFFKATKFQADAQRRRDFRAAQAFLPAALDDLSRYLKRCAIHLESAWNAVAERHHGDDQTQADPVDVPTLPTSHQEVFAQCIRYAEPQEGDFLAKVLAELQVLDARLSHVTSDQDGNGRVVEIRGLGVLLSYIHSLGILQARINRLFPFGRNEAALDVTPAQWDELRNAYANLKIVIERYEDPRFGTTLEKFGERWVARHSSERF